ncbi:hypothetical protein DPMN_036282 [Dreissena polymorpha]|uniref:Uncharacterized protein n=1 Tax=Dreissena polymorpha TaxID=45954 RepID=A0A9D4MDC2_DREPO|nr:hypothetical protein DPMN_095117 [Dreissena polymorpha]KAH3873056.1 hypothetical protein DPMN_036282 [Dreissena polymorpha]
MTAASLPPLLSPETPILLEEAPPSDALFAATHATTLFASSLLAGNLCSGDLRYSTSTSIHGTILEYTNIYSVSVGNAFGFFAYTCIFMAVIC